MTVRKLALPFLSLSLFLAACGDEGGGAGLENLVPADPAYFANQQFVCSPNPTAPPACPPFSCEVDVDGAVSACDAACNTSDDLLYCTAFVFTGPLGLDLCVPSQCTVALDGSTECTDDCAEDDLTCYVMDLFQSTCS